MIHLVFPAGSRFPTVAEQWYRLPSGEIHAYYTREQLAIAAQIADAVDAGRPAAAQPAPNALDEFIRQIAACGEPWVIRS